MEGKNAVNNFFEPYFTKKTVSITNKHIKYLNPVELGAQSCPAGDAFGPSIRDHWLLHYVVKGKGIFNSSGSFHEVNAGQCFIIRPSEKTYYKADLGEPWSYIWIGFTADIPLPDILKTNYVIDAAEYEPLFINMINSDCKSHLEESLSGRLWELMLIIQDNEKGNDRKNSHTTEQIKNFIESNYMKKISIQQIADQLHLNRCYMSTLFTKEMGVSPQQYLCEYRLNKALYFLRELKLSPGETAAATGYSDIYIFSRMFKKHFGFTPSSCKNDNNN